MKVAIVLVIFVCEAFTARRLYNGHDCPLGSIKHILIDCNFCRCHQGNLVNCTHFICTKDGLLIESGEEKVCVEKEMKYDKCTVCRCLNNTWYCTEPRCDPPHKRSISESFCLFEGMKKQKGCNSCVCQEGKWECSKDTCLAKEGAVQYINFFADDLNEVECVALDVLVIDCFVCKCNENCKGYSCVKSETCNVEQPIEVIVRSAKIYIDAILED